MTTLRSDRPSCWLLRRASRPEWVSPDGRTLAFGDLCRDPASAGWCGSVARSWNPGAEHVWVSPDDLMAEPVIMELRIATLTEGRVDIRPWLARLDLQEIAAFAERPRDLLERQGDILAGLVDQRAPGVLRAQRNLEFWSARRKASLNLVFVDGQPEAVRGAMADLHARLDFMQAVQGLAA